MGEFVGHSMGDWSPSPFLLKPFTNRDGPVGPGSVEPRWPGAPSMVHWLTLGTPPASVTRRTKSGRLCGLPTWPGSKAANAIHRLPWVSVNTHGPPGPLMVESDAST